MTQEIKPTYVTFEQGKWLKEKGFDEYCDQYYSQALFEGTNKDWEGIFPKFTVFKRSDFHFNSKPQNNDLWFECSAPEQWQVVEWLRVNHGIWITVDIDINGVYKNFIRKYNSKDRAWEVKYATSISEKYYAPQEAYSAAFDYILNNNLV